MKYKLLSMIIAVTLIVTLITPIQAHAAVKISKSKATLEVDATLKLKITGTKSKVSWKSSDKSVAKVSSKGVVTAKEEGTATITATIKKKSYSCEISVVESIESISKKMLSEKIEKFYTDYDIVENIINNKKYITAYIYMSSDMSQESAYEKGYELGLSVSDILLKKDFSYDFLTLNTCYPNGLLISSVIVDSSYNVLTASYTNTNSSKKDGLSKKTAEEIINDMAVEIPYISNIIVYDEETDVNNLLGRPHGYISKVNYADSREEQLDPENPVGGTIEVFDNLEWAQERYDYLLSVFDAYPLLRMYIYNDMGIVYRIDRELTPSQVQEYYNTFLKVIE